MAGPSLATQRKNKPTVTPPGTTVIVEQDENLFLPSTLSLTDASSSSSPVVPSNPTAAAGGTVVVATVYRRFCGTSPFDKHWLNLDCCGLICAALTYLLHLYGIWAVCTVLLPPWMSHSDVGGTRRTTMTGNLHGLIFSFIAIMACISHFNAMTTDPGAVPPDAKPLQLEPQPDQCDNYPQLQSPGRGNNSNKRTCRRCNSFKPLRAHHCSICRRCIIKMDHHCPWVNNCVGIGNHKYFLLFLFYTFLSCMYSSALLIVRFFICMKIANHHNQTIGLLHDNDQRCLNDPRDLLPLVGLAIECMLFGLFTSCMIIDQWDVVISNVTNIDRIKGEYHYSALSNSVGKTDAHRLKGVHEVFGPTAGFKLNWLVPFVKVTFPQSVRDEIMGFCTPCSSYYKRSSDDDLEMGTKRIEVQ